MNFATTIDVDTAYLRNDLKWANIPWAKLVSSTKLHNVIDWRDPEENLITHCEH